MNPNPFHLVEFIIKHYAFSGPIVLWVFYQVLKIEFARIDKRREVTWSLVSRFGSEMIVICIPILLTLWKNPASKLCKEYSQEPFFLAWAFILLFFSVGISLAAVRRYETPPEKRILLDFANKKLKLDRSKQYFGIILGFLRKLFYFSWSVGLGFMWFLSLYSYR